MSSDSVIQKALSKADAVDAAAGTLALVGKELIETIRNAHLALEDSIEGRGGSAALVRCGQLLHQARGAMRMCEIYGAALLTEEMESICTYLASLRAGKGREDGLDALTRAMVQLPSYIESLLGGGRDIALVLLPMLNDLRAARGQPLLSEGTLLLLNLTPSQEKSARAARDISGEDPAVVARKLRPKFQLALLGWLNGSDPEKHLQTLSGVMAALERCAKRDDMYQLCWVVGGILESLQNGGLETSISIKRLLGQTDRQIKHVIDEGEKAFDSHRIDDLLNNLLYYVARSSQSGKRISEIRAAFNLSELLPGEAQVEHARESLSAPSIKLMKTVAAAIKEDLGRVKDVLDIFVRTGMRKAGELVPQLELLKKISDTLGVLGLGGLRGDIESEIERLKNLVEIQDTPDEKILIDIASTLLKVEDSLDQQLLRLIAPATSDGDAPEEQDPDFQQVAEAVMRESIINLARIKETFSEAISSKGDSHALDSVPSLLLGIKAALMMLEKTRAVGVIDRISELISLTLKGGGPGRLTQRELDRLADAIVSIEYYMETIKAGRREPWYMLDNAEGCLSAIDQLEQRLADKGAEAPTADVEREEDREEEEVAIGEFVATQVSPVSVMAPSEERIDPELLELFIEEAKDEVASIKRHLPQWRTSPDDMETLITMRRSFHTLKGSGRMVGAERIGEYCWAVENLLNRLINRTLLRTPPMVDFIIAAAAAVPELVEQLEVGTEPKADINLLIARANAFAEGDPNAPVLTLEATAKAQEESDVTALEMDPVLLDIFSKETAGHLKAIEDYVAACSEHRAPFTVTDKLYRACHTLHGSANMANVDRGVAVSGALNRFVRRVHDYESALDRTGIEALEAAIVAIKNIVADINQTSRPRQDFTVLVNHIDLLCDAVKQPDKEADEQVEAEVAEPEIEEPLESEDEYDAEIAAIFSEEAGELLEAADKSLAVWSQEKDSQQYVAELKRQLHTLKGGARMAGIMVMGNLSHEVETLLAHIEDGRLQSSEAVHVLLQESIDDLHRMRDAVIAGKKAVRSQDLESRIRKQTSGFGDDVAATGVAAIEPEAEVVIEAKADLDADVEQVPEPEVATQAEVAAESDDEALADVQDVAEPEVEAQPDEQDEVEAEIETELDDGHEEVPEVEAEVDVRDEEELEAEAAAEEKAEDEVATDVEAKAETEEKIEEVAEEETTEGEVEEEAEEEPEVEGAEPEIVEELGEKLATNVRPFPVQPPAEPRQEFARIDAELLEDLLNAAGEISIYHSRLSQQVSLIDFNLEELDQTVHRLREQLRKLEIETESQIMHRHQDTLTARDFDPLEMDRYSTIQQLSRALAESAADMGSLRDLLQNVTGEADTLLVQQARVTAELQDGLMRTRMVPFQQHVPRLTRLVRQVVAETGKRAELAVEGGSGELDRQVLDKMLPPFEHMLRNALVHGIETPAERQAAGKPATGRITIRLHREGAEMVIDVADDGAGLNVEAIRSKAYERGMLEPGSRVDDSEILELILTPGFSTAGVLTQTAGRGVGMDVVATEVKKLGGSLSISSVTGQGSNFTIRLPFTLAITQALIVRTGEEVYALPLPTVEGVARISPTELNSLLSQPDPSYQYGEQTYRFRHLGMYLGGQAAKLPDDGSFVSVILVRAGEHSAALLTDEMLASREVVVKSAGPQLAGIRGISGATILGDGSIVLILDVGALVRGGVPIVELKNAAPAPSDKRPLAMVVDDSITVRRVMERFLQRNGMQVITAKDGLDAVGQLRDNKPDIILLDIEMPRMDGYEFATHVRNDPRISDIPIIMITSRVGDKHRARAIEIGVNDYLGKPYQESQLLDAVQRLLEDRGIRLQ